MTLALTQSATAVGPGITASFHGTGGTEPYLYSVVPGGAGGTIDPTTGKYTAPAAFSSDPSLETDTVLVTDYVSATATARIAVLPPLMLFCDVIQKEMGLADGRVYLWDQKIFQPTDSGLYIAVRVASCKPFGNVNRHPPTGGGLDSQQYVTMHATLELDVISKGPEARDRKEEVILALMSDYAVRQQNANGFYIGKLPAGSRFTNLSYVDGAAIPYRFQIAVAMQYVFSKTSAALYFSDFRAADVSTDP